MLSSSIETCPSSTPAMAAAVVAVHQAAETESRLGNRWAVIPEPQQDRPGSRAARIAAAASRQADSGAAAISNSGKISISLLYRIIAATSPEERWRSFPPQRKLRM